jgi:hypothetical protein
MDAFFFELNIFSSPMKCTPLTSQGISFEKNQRISFGKKSKILSKKKLKFGAHKSQGFLGGKSQDKCLVQKKRRK